MVTINIQDTSERIKLVMKDSENVSKMIEEIAAVTEQAAASVEQTAASASNRVVRFRQLRRVRISWQ